MGGNILYGMDIPNIFAKNLNNVINIYANITKNKNKKENSYIGYSNQYYIKKNNRTLIINFGYYNGYPKFLTNKSFIFSNGFYIPIVGRVSMNCLVADAYFIPEYLLISLVYVEVMGLYIN